MRRALPLLLFLLCAPILALANLVNTNCYLGVTPPFGDGSSASAPLDASTAAKLDAIYAARCWQGSDHPSTSITFIYAPGTYQTRGWDFQQRETMLSGNYHVGAGRGQTIIQLVGAYQLTADGTVFAADGHWTSYWGVSNLTIDCNAQKNLKFTSGLGAVAAIGAAGADNCTVSNVEVINFGTGHVTVECFPISFFANSIAGTMTNIYVENCLFDHPATGNKDGCSVVAMNDAPQNGVTMGIYCIVQNCSFENCKSDFLYCHCAEAPWVLNNYAINSGVFFYTEPLAPQWSTTTIEVTGNHVINADTFFNSIPHPGGSLACPIGIGLNTIETR